MNLPEHLDEKNPFAVLSLLGGALRASVEKLPEDLTLMSERQLRHHIQPTNTDYSLRTSFWREYERVVKMGGDKLTAASIFNGVCSDAYFYQKFIKDPFRVAWLVTPLQTYLKEIEAVLVRGTERLWEIIEMDITYVDKHGDRQIDAKKASVVLDAIKMVENRAKGLAVQRNETKSVSVHMSGPKRVSVTGSSDDTLEARIKELQERVSGGDPHALGDVIEGEAS